MEINVTFLLFLCLPVIIEITECYPSSRFSKNVNFSYGSQLLSNSKKKNQQDITFSGGRTRCLNSRGPVEFYKCKNTLLKRSSANEMCFPHEIISNKSLLLGRERNANKPFMVKDYIRHSNPLKKRFIRKEEPNNANMFVVSKPMPLYRKLSKGNGTPQNELQLRENQSAFNPGSIASNESIINERKSYNIGVIPKALVNFGLLATTTDYTSASPRPWQYTCCPQHLSRFYNEGSQNSSGMPWLLCSKEACQTESSDQPTSNTTSAKESANYTTQLMSTEITHLNITPKSNTSNVSISTLPENGSTPMVSSDASSRTPTFGTTRSKFKGLENTKHLSVSPGIKMTTSLKYSPISKLPGVHKSHLSSTSKVSKPTQAKVWSESKTVTSLSSETNANVIPMNQAYMLPLINLGNASAVKLILQYPTQAVTTKSLNENFVKGGNQYVKSLLLRKSRHLAGTNTGFNGKNGPVLNDFISNSMDINKNRNTGISQTDGELLNKFQKNSISKLTRECNKRSVHVDFFSLGRNYKCPYPRNNTICQRKYQTAPFYNLTALLGPIYSPNRNRKKLLLCCSEDLTTKMSLPVTARRSSTTTTKPSDNATAKIEAKTNATANNNATTKVNIKTETSSVPVLKMQKSIHDQARTTAASIPFSKSGLTKTSKQSLLILKPSNETTVQISPNSTFYTSTINVNVDELLNSSKLLIKNNNKSSNEDTSNVLLRNSAYNEEAFINEFGFNKRKRDMLQSNKKFHPADFISQTTSKLEKGIDKLADDYKENRKNEKASCRNNGKPYQAFEQKHRPMSEISIEHCTQCKFVSGAFQQKQNRKKRNPTRNPNDPNSVDTTLAQQKYIETRSIFAQLLPCMGRAPKAKDHEKKPWEQPWTPKHDRFQLYNDNITPDPLEFQMTDIQFLPSLRSNNNSSAKYQERIFGFDDVPEVCPTCGNKRILPNLQDEKQDGYATVESRQVNDAFSNDASWSKPCVIPGSTNCNETRRDNCLTYVLNYAKDDKDDLCTLNQKVTTVKSLRLIEKINEKPKYYMEIPETLGDLIKNAAIKMMTSPTLTESNIIFEKKGKFTESNSPSRGALKPSHKNLKKEPVFVILQPYEINKNKVYLPLTDLHKVLRSNKQVNPLTGKNTLSIADPIYDFSENHQRSEYIPSPSSENYLSLTPAPFALIPAYLPVPSNSKVQSKGQTDYINFDNPISVQDSALYSADILNNSKNRSEKIIENGIGNNLTNKSDKVIIPNTKLLNSGRELEHLIEEEENQIAFEVSNTYSTPYSPHKSPYLVIMHDPVDDTPYIEFRKPLKKEGIVDHP